jgi:hypothetical protein
LARAVFRFNKPEQVDLAVIENLLIAMEDSPKAAS